MADLRHGSVRAYWNGCRCPASLAGRAAYTKARRVRAAAPAVIDASRARERLHRWLSRGIGIHQIVQATGLCHMTVRRTLAGATKPCGNTVRCILEATPGKGDGSTVSSWRTRKLIKALLAEEYRPAAIAKALGRQHLRFRARVFVGFERRVEGLYKAWMGEGEEE